MENRQRIKICAVQLRAALFIFASTVFFPGCLNNSLQSGFQVVPLRNTSESNASQQYVAYIPHQKNDPLPVLLFLNGYGENGSDGLFQVSNNFGQSIWRRRNQFPFLAVCPQCSKGGVWDENGPDTTYALRCLDDAIERFGGDPLRVYITGVSSGAEGVMRVLSAHPDRFVAALPISFGARGKQAIVPPESIPFRCLVNKFDNKNLVNDIRSARLKWLLAGRDPVVIEAEGLENQPHNAWDEAYNSPNSLGWLLQQTKRSTKQAITTELLSSEQILYNWQHGGIETWKPNDEFEIACTATQAADLLQSPNMLVGSSIHFEVYLDPANSTQVILSLYDEQREVSSIAIEIELPRIGTGGVHDGKGNWFGLLEPAAQHALVQGWNEVRIRVDSKALSLKLRGWPAFELKESVTAKTFRLGIIAKAEFETRVRFIRVPKRSIDSDPPE